MYKVVSFFHDLQDENHEYNIGDVYPREDAKPSEERIAELLGSDNVRGYPLIEEIQPEEVAEPETKKPASTVRGAKAGK